MVGASSSCDGPHRPGTATLDRHVDGRAHDTEHRTVTCLRRPDWRDSAMAIDTASPRSRRALLGAVIGAGVATAAAAIRPLSARAADGETALLGKYNYNTLATRIASMASASGTPSCPTPRTGSCTSTSTPPRSLAARSGVRSLSRARSPRPDATDRSSRPTARRIAGHERPPEASSGGPLCQPVRLDVMRGAHRWTPLVRPR